MGKNAQRRKAKREAEWLANMGQMHQRRRRFPTDKVVAERLRIGSLTSHQAGR